MEFAAGIVELPSRKIRVLRSATAVGFPHGDHVLRSQRSRDRSERYVREDRGYHVRKFAADFDNIDELSLTFLRLEECRY